MTRPTRRRSLLAATGALLVAAALVVLPASAASAHDYLVDSSPEAGSTVTTPPSKVSLTFDDIVLDIGGHGALVTVTDASGRHFETGCAKVLDRTVTTPVALGGKGDYTATWQIVSADGHPVSAAIVFHYAPAAGSKIAAGSPHGPGCGESTAQAVAPVASGSPGATPQADPGAGVGLGHPAVVILSAAGGVVVLAIVAVLMLLVLARRRNARDRAQDDRAQDDHPDDD